MSNFFIAFLIAVSSSVWIYSKLMRNTGGNAKSAATAATVSGVIIFAIVMIIMGIIL